MPAIRIFLLTYRRPQLLRRALNSLRAQTFTDWVCELHNDDPYDQAPAKLIAEFNDPRITVCQHEQNWGAIASFNHVFRGSSEPFATLLEDDNWWEPNFLEQAYRTITAHPDASMVWANMHIWTEQDDSTWADTNRTIWSTQEDPIRIFRWPEAIQSFTAIHSQGAMLFRPGKFSPQNVPDDTPLAVIENFRERCAMGNLILISKPLANFAITRQTNREVSRDHWMQSQLLVSSSYFHTVNFEKNNLRQIWAHLRSTTPRDTNLLFLTAITLRRSDLVKPARPLDWLYFLLNLMRNPRSAWRALRFRKAHPNIWQWLQQYTRAAEVRANPLVIDKH